MMLDTVAPFFHDEKRMDDHRLSRSYLETLSTEDLSVIADRLGLDLPPGLNRIFVIEELLDTQSELDRPGLSDPGEALTEDTQHPAVNGLPPAYNRTYIEVLLRDPIWAFAFWEVRSADREAYEGAVDFGGYRLRVSTSGGLGETAAESFSIAIGPDDTAWYLCVPSPVGSFKVELCAVKGKREQVLASSPPLRVPACRPALEVAEDTQRSILLLSGLDDFRIIRSVDRSSHLPERCEY